VGGVPWENSAMRSIVNILLVSVLLAVAAPAQQRTGYGEVSLNNVRARAGTADYHAELMVLPRGYPVRIVGFEGDWARVQLPGGILAYVHKGRRGHPYVKEASPGRGLVVVNDLMLRPKPTTDWPAMGKLKPNQEITLLGSEGKDWFRILAPKDQVAYIWKDYVKVSADQKRAQALFEAKAAEVRAGRLQAGELSRKGLVREERRKRLLERLATTDQAMEKVLTSSDGLPDLGALERLRGQYRDIASAAVADADLRAEAERKASYVQGKIDVVQKLAKAERKVDELAAKEASSRREYEESLSRFRRKKEKTAKTSEDRGAGRFLRYGIGVVRRDVLNSISGEPAYILSKASEDRYLLTSLRYDLSEYLGREIGITKWKMLTPPTTDELRRVQVTRLEILD